jgi:hypothetical protein
LTNQEQKTALWAVVWAIVATLVAFAVVIGLGFALDEQAGARPGPQWAQLNTEDLDGEVHKFIAGLTQPDSPHQSCCGEADLYYADKTEAGPNGEFYAVITDDRGPEYDFMARRRTRPVGTRILVPAPKLKVDKGNITEHGLLFIGTSDDVYCFVPQFLG